MMAKPNNPQRINKLEAQLEYANSQLSLREKQLKQLRKKDMLFDAIIDEVDDIIKPLHALPTTFKPNRKGEIDVEDMVLHLSDSHMDRTVTASSVQGLESYNFPEAVVRAENLVERFLRIKNEKLKNYSFPTLYILMYGDNTNGTIHDYESKSAFRNQFKNCFAIANVYAMMIRDIAPQFGKVEILCVPGNHGRVHAVKKDYEDAHNTWDYMVCETARLLTQNIKNVHFNIPNSYSAIVDINGWNFFVEHGDDIKAWNGIPYYGIERKTRRIMSLHASQDLFIHYFVNGHFHTATNLSNLGNSESLVNGAWLATDPYALSLGFQGEPSQWMHGVSKTQGITFRYKVRLRDKIKRKPDRYASVLDMYTPS